MRFLTLHPCMTYRRILFPAAMAALASFDASAARADQYDPPATYYNAATGTGATLKSQLHTIISANVNQHTYDDARIALQTIDADPNNASNVLLVYNGASVPGVWDNGVTWNREHCWPN